MYLTENIQRRLMIGHYDACLIFLQMLFATQLPLQAQNRWHVMTERARPSENKLSEYKLGTISAYFQIGLLLLHIICMHICLSSVVFDSIMCSRSRDNKNSSAFCMAQSNFRIHTIIGWSRRLRGENVVESLGAIHSSLVYTEWINTQQNLKWNEWQT